MGRIIFLTVILSTQLALAQEAAQPQGPVPFNPRYMPPALPPPALPNSNRAGDTKIGFKWNGTQGLTMSVRVNVDGAGNNFTIDRPVKFSEWKWTSGDFKLGSTSVREILPILTNPDSAWKQAINPAPNPIDAYVQGQVLQLRSGYYKSPNSDSTSTLMPYDPNLDPYGMLWSSRIFKKSQTKPDATPSGSPSPLPGVASPKAGSRSPASTP